MKYENIINYRKEFHKYVYWLGDDIPRHMQDEAKEFLIHCDEAYIPYIICTENAFTWNNAIKVLKKIGYPKNKSATCSMMYLLQDVNWPCSKIAVTLLNEIYTFDNRYFLKSLESIIVLANKKKDVQWIWGLRYLKEYLKISDGDFYNKDALNIINNIDY